MKIWVNESLFKSIWVAEVEQCRAWLEQSSRVTSFSGNSAWTLSLRLSLCCAVPEMQCWQWEEQRLGIRFIAAPPHYCFQRRFRKRGGCGVTLEEDQNHILSVWKSDMKGSGLRCPHHPSNVFRWWLPPLSFNLTVKRMFHIFHPITSFQCLNSFHGSRLPFDSDLMWKLLDFYH